uniref:DUF5901 domain-containing protein n=1 Tax=viral metagenome TaxID=1070528 RepID=A0A6C0CRR6_9ZZZZ
MPIEDVDYLKKNSEKQNYIFLVNSKDRDKETFQTPSEYVVDFTNPFTNVIGLNVIDAAIPRTMYNIDYYNNTFYYFIHSSNYDMNQISESMFQKTTLDPGDYTIQTLVDTLNKTLYMPLNSNLSSCNVYITASTLSNPPDVKNRIQFDCPYPFMFDMKRSTIAENLGFDLYIQTAENLKSDLIKDYQPFFINTYPTITDSNVIQVYNETRKKKTKDEIIAGLPLSYTIAQTLTERIYPFGTNLQLYHSVDLPFSQAKGTSYTIFEGPRGVINQIPLTSKVAQQFYVSSETTLTQLFVAFYTNVISTNRYGEFELRTDNNNTPDSLLAVSNSNIAISYVDGTLSDSSNLTSRLYANSNYWIVFKENPNISVYYNDVLTEKTTFLVYNGSSWVPARDDLTNKIYYQLSMQINVTDDYHRIKSPGIYSLIGEPYIIIRCKEIEENSFRSLSYMKHQLGIAKIKLGIVGYREERLDFANIPLREFHPIGRLSRLTLRFETASGQLYDFKGVNHNITFSIQYYEPKIKADFQKSIINSNYNGNFIDYMYKQEEQEEESDDQDIDYNRDTLESYRRAESRNLPWQFAQRNIQQYYDLNVDEDQLEEEEDEEES